MDVQKSPVEVIEEAHRRIAVWPGTLPVLPGTWLSLKGMRIEVPRGQRVFIDEGRDTWNEFHDHWGWWKTQVCGWRPYTHERDFYRHDRTGQGRPWLRSLDMRWQELIFRELVLLIEAWNQMVDDEHRYRFGTDEREPTWMQRWLALTNEAFVDGIDEIRQEATEFAHSGLLDYLDASETLVARYRFSEKTWRPMMPMRAVYHRRYAERGEYWTFERTEVE